MYMDFKRGLDVFFPLFISIWKKNVILFINIKMNSSLPLYAYKLFHLQINRLSFVIERQIVSL